MSPTAADSNRFRARPALCVISRGVPSSPFTSYSVSGPLVTDTTICCSPPTFTSDGIVAGPDERQHVLDDPSGLDRPAGDERVAVAGRAAALGLDRVDPRGLSRPPRAARRSSRRRPRSDAAVDLVASPPRCRRAPSPSRSPIAGLLIDSAVICSSARQVGVDQAHREAGRGRAVGPVGAQPPVEPGHDDAQRLAGPAEARHRGRGEEAALGVLEVVLACCSDSAQLARRGIGPHRPAGQRVAVGLPHVDALAGGGDHLGPPVAGQVGDRRGARRLERRVERLQRRRLQMRARRELRLGPAPASPAAPSRPGGRRAPSRPRSGTISSCRLSPSRSA